MGHPISSNPEDANRLSSLHKALTAAIDLTAGTAGGVANVLVGQPLDTVKVKMQAFPKLYPSALQCFSKTLEQDGIVRGLYAGTLPALAANVAENSVLFCAYGMCQQLVQRLGGKSKTGDLSPLENASAGFCAAFFSSLTLCPTELVKCRLQALRESHDECSQENKKLAPKLQCNQQKVTAFTQIKTIWQQEGLQGFFRGLVPTFAREMPGYFFFFGGYELSKIWLTPPGMNKDNIGPTRTIIAGGVGGTCLWVSIFPADVIKSRMQISSHTRISAVQVARDLVQREGFLALYSGLLPTVLRTFPSTGALFVAYEYTRKSLSAWLV